MLLRAIAETKTKISQRQLAETLGWALGKVNRLVSSAAKNGLLEKKGCTLTPQGRWQLHHVFPAFFPAPTSTGDVELPF
jgi:DNA-binding IclR family transcriptional regulator